MKTVLALLLIATTTPTFAQYLLDGNYSNPLSDSCLADPNITVFHPEYWEVYQTTNDEWDGPRDSICLNLVNQGNFVVSVYLDEILPGKPFFVRQTFTDNTKILYSNNGIFLFTMQVFPSGFLLDTSLACGGSPCSGVWAGIDIPDSAGTGRTMRWHTAPFTSNTNGSYGVRMCMPTEKFSDNYLREFYFKFMPGAFSAGDSIKLEPVYVEELTWNYEAVNDINIGNFNASQFAYEIQTTWTQQRMLMHYGLGYPHPNNVSYTHLTPVPNVDTVATVSMTIFPGSSLIYQPHTAFRGGLLLNDTVQRHNINVINQGELCLSGIIEIMIGNHNQFTLDGGTISFGGARACMLVYDGGIFSVPDGVDAHYGKNNLGMFALLPEGVVDIGHNASLTIHNTMIVCQKKNNTETLPVEITLEQGSSLKFAPGARLTSCDDQTKLTIHMKGGHLDTRHLPNEDLKHIQLVYTDGRTPQHYSDHIKVYPNPASHHIKMEIDVPAPTLLTAIITDVKGNIVHTENFNALAGTFSLEMEVNNLAQGAYTLRLQSADQQLNHTTTWVKK